MSDDVAMFVDEVTEYLDAFGSELLRLEVADAAETVDALFRAAHNVKGMSAMEGYDGLARLTHAVETFLVRYRDGGGRPSADEVDLLLRALDATRGMVAAVGDEPAQAPPAELLRELEQVAGGGTQEGEEAPSAEAGDSLPPPEGSAAASLTVKLSPSCPLPGARAAVVLEAVAARGALAAVHPARAVVEDGEALQFEIGLTAGVDVEQLVAAVAAIPDVEAAWSGRPLAAASGPTPTTARVAVDRLDELMNMAGELVIDRNSLRQRSRELQDPRLAAAVSRIDRSVADLHATVAQVRLVRLEPTLRRMQRLVRDTARELGKDVHLDVDGHDVELDRSVAEHITEPMVHLLRNAIDHGLESAEDRARRGKPATGQIRLSAGQTGKEVIVEVADDGRGIDTEAVTAKAIAAGLITADDGAAVDPSRLNELIFAPGFTTAGKASSVSGRGVGLDVVHSQMRAVGGSIQVRSRPGEGTAFRLRVPVSLTVVEALLVDTGETVVAIPMSHVHEVMEAGGDEIWEVRGRRVLAVRGELVPGDDLGRLFECNPALAASSQVVIVGDAGHRVALAVKGVIGPAEVLVKPVPPLLRGVRHVAGVTLLPDGRVGAILDVPGLFAGAAPAGDEGLAALP